MSKTLKSLKNKEKISEEITEMVSSWDRFRGLLGKKKISENAVYWFPRCKSIHTWWMSIPIDVVFLKKISDLEYEITSCFSSVRPNRFFPLFDFYATDVWECKDGFIDQKNLKKGDRVWYS